MRSHVTLWEDHCYTTFNSQHYIKHYYTSCIVMPHYEDLCCTTLNTTLGTRNTLCVVMTHYEKTTITIHFTESSHIVKSPLLECYTLLYILLGTHDMSCSHLYTQHCTHSTVHCTLDNQNYTHAKMFCSPFPQGMNWVGPAGLCGQEPRWGVIQVILVTVPSLCFCQLKSNAVLFLNSI